jgi:hypothetical protein
MLPWSPLVLLVIWAVAIMGYGFFPDLFARSILWFSDAIGNKGSVRGLRTHCLQEVTFTYSFWRARVSGTISEPSGRVPAESWINVSLSAE